MGVFCTDRLTGGVLGLSGRLWSLTGQALSALDAPHLDPAWTKDGYVPARIARAWGALLFDGLGNLVVVCRPVPGRGAELRPLVVVRAGSSSAAAWARRGEPLSVYDVAFAPVLLRVAQFCTAGSGHTVTTLRPPAPATPLSEVAARVLLERSGVLSSSHR